MSLLACLNEAVPDPADLLMSDGVFNLAAPMLVVALIFVTPLAWLTRNRYRRWVMRLMGMNQLTEAPAALQRAAAGDMSPRWAPGGGAADKLALTLADGERRVIWATMAGGLTFMLVAVWIGGLGEHTGTWPRLAFAGAAGLLALGPLMTNLPIRWSRHAHRAGALAGVLAALLLWWLEAQGPDMPGAAETGDDAGLEDLLIAACLVMGYWAMFDRRLRGQVQPLVVLVCVALLAALLPYGWLERHAGSCLQQIDRAAEAGTATPMIMWVLAMSTLVIFGTWLGFRAVAGLVWLLERRHFSEQSLGSALCLVLLAVALVIFQTPDKADEVRAAHVLAPLLWPLASFGAYALALALMPGRGRGSGPGPQLLVLRVFSTDQRKHVLLDAVQARWRFLGPVHQIGGPDLVAMNVDPYEAAMYLSYRMHWLFLPSALGPAALQAQLDGLPCRDGRHRINEVFCFNTAWRQTVEQLMLSSDAIVLDVRGMGAQREGTSYEIGRLAECGLLARVVAIGDADTDWAHIDALLQRHGGDLQRLQCIGGRRAGMAAGAENAMGSGDADGDIDAVLARLMQAAAAGKPDDTAAISRSA